MPAAEALPRPREVTGNGYGGGAKHLHLHLQLPAPPPKQDARAARSMKPESTGKWPRPCGRNPGTGAKKPPPPPRAADMAPPTSESAMVWEVDAHRPADAKAESIMCPCCCCAGGHAKAAALNWVCHSTGMPAPAEDALPSIPFSPL